MSGEDDLYQENTATVERPSLLRSGFSPAQAFVLRQVGGPGAPQDFGLDGGCRVIGRSQTADINIDSPELSRLHAEIFREDHEFVIRDLDSRNGVFLEGVRIRSSVLRGGDVLQIGNVTFLFLESF